MSSELEYWQTVGQWEELERAGREEIEAREREDRELERLERMKEQDE